eukprot:scaffold112_cov57-Attheya_sp.AAC.6
MMLKKIGSAHQLLPFGKNNRKRQQQSNSSQAGTDTVSVNSIETITLCPEETTADSTDIINQETPAEMTSDILREPPTEIQVCQQDIPDLYGAIEHWVKDATHVLQSEPMIQFAHSTQRLAGTAALSTVNGVCRIVFLPVTVTAHVAGTATSLVTNTASSISTQIRIMTTASEGVTERPSSWQGVIGNALAGVIPMTWNILSSTTVDVCGTVLSMVSPALQVVGLAGQFHGDESNRSLSCSAGQSSSECSSPFDRLRIDFAPKIEEGEPDSAVFHLRVCDLDLQHIQEASMMSAGRITHVALHLETPHPELVVQTLDKMARLGAVLTVDKGTSLSWVMTPEEWELIPRWKPEGNTKKLMRKQQELESGSTKWISILDNDILVWSGRTTDKLGKYGRGAPVFKARGFVNISPHDLTDLLLDSDRVQLYNKYSLGRSDDAVLQSGVNSKGGKFGVGETKIVRSKTKIPLAGKNIMMVNVMHARPLDRIASSSSSSSSSSTGMDHADSGYIIISRSVCFGDSKAASENEIVWGVNILKSVPDHPGKTELLSISQWKNSLMQCANAARRDISIFELVRLLTSQLAQ